MPRVLSKTVFVLGLTSFFADIASEMIFPLLPVFLTTTLRAGPAFLGLIEGAADTVASLLKLAAGRASDRFGRRKPLVVFGYGLAGFSRPWVALASTPWHVLSIRLTDRVGKGIRTAPRDALIADTSAPEARGRAFGFHRAMDHAGALVGPLIASLLLARGVGVRHVFAIAAVPSALSIVIAALAPEPPRRAPLPLPQAKREQVPPALPRRLRNYLLILLVFSIGNSSDAFLLLRARELGVAEAMLPLLWATLHLFKFASTYVGGIIADRVPKARMVVAGWALYALVYVLLGVVHSTPAAWGLFCIYGFYYGLTEPAEKAMVGELSPDALRGRAFGAYNLVIGIAALPAGLLMGALWSRWGASAALTFGAAMAGAATLLMSRWMRVPAPRG